MSENNTNVKEWTASKNTNDFDYDEAQRTLIENKSLTQSIHNYLHLNISNEKIEENFKAIENLNNDYIGNILEVINEYAYYLEMNKILEGNKLYAKELEKLKKLIKILDDDFINFLGSNLHLDKTIIISKEGLKVKQNCVGVIEEWLRYDFKFALNDLDGFFSSHPVKKNSISLENGSMNNSFLIKHDTKAYLKPIGSRAILKCLYFDLLYCFDDVSKAQAVDIIREFFSITLEIAKVEHTLSSETVKMIKQGGENMFLLEELQETFRLKDFIKDNFLPHFTSLY